MFNFQRWKVRKFLRRFRRWVVDEINEKKESKEDAPLSPASTVLLLPQKKRKEKKVKRKPRERSREPWANFPRPAGKAVAVHSIAQAREDRNTVSMGGVEGFRTEEDFFDLLPIDQFIPPNFDKECFKAVILFGFLRPTIRYKPINFNYVPAESIMQRIVNKGYQPEKVKQILKWLQAEQLVISSHHISYGRIPMSLNIKPLSIGGVEAKKICQACVDALAKLRVAR